MLLRVVRFFDVLLVALVVGSMFGIWLGYNPTSLSPAAYVEHQQLAIRSLNVVLPILGAACILLTVVWAVLVKSNRRVRTLLLFAVLFLVAAGLITRLFNQPINAQVMTWSAQSLPSNWSRLRDHWWFWHTVRTLAGLVALGSLVLARELSVDGLAPNNRWRGP